MDNATQNTVVYLFRAFTIPHVNWVKKMSCNIGCIHLNTKSNNIEKAQVTLPQWVPASRCWWYIQLLSCYNSQFILKVNIYPVSSRVPQHISAWWASATMAEHTHPFRADEHWLSGDSLVRTARWNIHATEQGLGITWNAVSGVVKS